MCLLYYSFDKPIKANDIVRMSRSFGFTNTNYIKKYPDIFIDQLKTMLLKKYGTDGINLKNIITDSELSKIRSAKMRIFANMSLLKEEILVPQFVNNATLKKEIYYLLETTHNNIKTLIHQEIDKLQKLKDIYGDEYINDRIIKKKGRRFYRKYTCVQKTFYYL